MWQLLKNFYKCVTKTTTMLQLMYNVHTCDHAMCPHSTTHYEIHLQLIFNYDFH